MPPRRLRTRAATAIVAALAHLASAHTAAAQTAPPKCPALTPGAALPLTFAGPPTTAAITACDLMTRLYQFANDSMGGRRIGTPDHERATAYIANEAKRLGLKPAGDGGTFYQSLPLVSRALDTTSTIAIAGGETLHAGTDFLATTTAAHTDEFRTVKLVYGGGLLDTTITQFPIEPTGQLVLFGPAPKGIDQSAIQRTPKGRAWVTWYNTVRNRATANAPAITPQALRTATNPTATVLLADQGATLTLTLTTGALAKLFGTTLDATQAGTASKPFTLNLRYADTPRIDRNVIAVLQGTDPKLRGQYVALGAHADHIGAARALADHDSVRAAHMGARSGAEGAMSRKQVTEDEEYDRIRFLRDSLHKARPVRLDSINNGADDGGSGTVALLEIAEAFAKGTVKPKRSVLFVWHTGTESTPTLSGSSWLMDHPTIPRDSIVAELTVDMIGRGEKSDEVGITADEEPRYGSPDFVEIIGSRRQSSEFGTLIPAANTDSKLGLKLDYAADADGHPEGLVCRNDQASYARFGIPSALFTTGYHADFRQVTDEPQYVQYQHMARIVQLVSATTLKVAGLDHRPSLDKPKPDSKAACKP